MCSSERLAHTYCFAKPAAGAAGTELAFVLLRRYQTHHHRQPVPSTPEAFLRYTRGVALLLLVVLRVSYRVPFGVKFTKQAYPNTRWLVAKPRPGRPSSGKAIRGWCWAARRRRRRTPQLAWVDTIVSTLAPPASHHASSHARLSPPPTPKCATYATAPRPCVPAVPMCFVTTTFSTGVLLRLQKGCVLGQL